MPTYFENLQDTEISGGDFASVSGDFVGVDGVRHSTGPKDKSERISYFANGKGLKITGGNFMTVGGSYYHRDATHAQLPPPPRPSPLPLGPQYGGSGGHATSRPSTPQMPALDQQTLNTPPAPPGPPPQEASYYYEGGFVDPAVLQEYQSTYTNQQPTNQPTVQYHPPPPAINTNVIRPSVLHSQSGPAGMPHLSADVSASASVEFRHTNTEPIPPVRTEFFIRPPSGLDVPNHRPTNLNPSIDIWAQRPGERSAESVNSDSDSNDENGKKKKKKKKRSTPSVTELGQQFKKVFTRTSE